MQDKFVAYSDQYNMLPPGSRVLCACSGGADSTALLHLLCAQPDITVICAHFNHRLRGAESDRDERFVRNLCQRLGVDCVVGGGDVADHAARCHLSTEAAARALRYAFLEETAQARQCDKIATAHHAEDNAETVLLNLVRGSGLKGLCGIPPVRGKIIRPLLNVTRAEIEEYLNKNGLSYVDDSTNGTDDCARNRIRHRVLPLLTEENSAAAEHICAAAELLRQDEEYLSQCAETFIEEHYSDDALPIPLLLALPQSIAVRVLRRICGPISRTHAAAVFALCRGGKEHASADIPGRRVVKEYDRLLFSPRSDTAIPRRELPFGETPIPEAGLCAVRRRTAPNEEIHNSFNTFFFKSDSIRGKIYVASRAEGGKIRLLGRGCTKTLKKLFQEAALPPAVRARTPVLYDEDGVIAVCGFGIAERCAAVNGEEAQCVEIIKTDK